MMETVKVTFQVNNEKTVLAVKPNETLLETLRERLDLTGAKESCGIGSCGACTVEVNGLPLRSCIVLTSEMEGADITTIEGLCGEGKLHPLQETFMEQGAVQCGFCTSGMIMTAKNLLDRNDEPTRKDIVNTISSNVCRCTGYKKIVAAVEKAGKYGR
ncbi:MAG: (2Fe-2S)-binding protein [Syntrophobacteraceae bacterium]|nr:(2Fe-2S)-binding protein [Syntrophobacteraceae bacterium]